MRDKVTIYARSRDGIIHAVNFAAGGEHTLCGDAWDIDSETEVQDKAWVHAPSGPVTCSKCCAQIRSLRGIRICHPSQERNP